MVELYFIIAYFLFLCSISQTNKTIFHTAEAAIESSSRTLLCKLYAPVVGVNTDWHLMILFSLSIPLIVYKINLQACLWTFHGSALFNHLALILM